MKNTFFFGILFAIFLGNAQETVSGTMIHDDVERIHKVYVPNSYNKEKPAPLLLLIHGYSEPAAWILQYTKFQPLAEKYGFIIACPEGKINEVKVPAWNFNPNGKGEITDINYVNAFIDKLTDDYSIDEKRIYITGFSQGGYMSFIAGCLLNNRIAAIAPVSGAMPATNLFKCNPVHSTPALVINGDNDTHVPYEGNSYGKPVKASLEFWVDYNNCDKTPVITSVPDKNPNDKQTVEKHEFLNGKNNSKVVHYKIIGGKHFWPGREENNSLAATPIIWEFLSQFKLE